ncbi:MAG: ferritin-like protein [Nitrospirae bacterium]|nr:ferritin-like protein [Magnetococcales bacterium]HAT50896.1 hypothetical protein [Alphaproteobacteria bacterium]
MDSHDIATLESLEEHLFSAMVLEHATLPAYLTALYSIKPGTNQDASNILRVVAVEEMLHMTIAANLLNAIGGTVNLTQTGFVPSYPTYLPDSIDDFQIHIEAFTPSALETFLKIERPVYLGTVQQRVVKRRIPNHVWCLSPNKDGTTQYTTIGEFYNAIKESFIRLEAEAQAKGSTIFTGDPAFQITSEYYYSGGGKLFPVTNLDSAVQAIDLVIEQGEGYVDEDKPTGVFDQYGEIAHFYRFEQLRLGRYYVRGDKPGFPTGPAIEIDWDAVYLTVVDPKLADYPEGSELYQAALNFNIAYAQFLALLTEAYNGKRELMMRAAVPAMFDFRNLMNRLIRNPAPQQHGRHAAATFEIDATNAILGTAKA